MKLKHRLNRHKPTIFEGIRESQRKDIYVRIFHGEDHTFRNFKPLPTNRHYRVYYSKIYSKRLRKEISKELFKGSRMCKRLFDRVNKLYFLRKLERNEETQ